MSKTQEYTLKPMFSGAKVYVDPAEKSKLMAYLDKISWVKRTAEVMHDPECVMVFKSTRYTGTDFMGDLLVQINNFFDMSNCYDWHIEYRGHEFGFRFYVSVKKEDLRVLIDYFKGKNWVGDAFRSQDKVIVTFSKRYMGNEIQAALEIEKALRDFYGM